MPTTVLYNVNHLGLPKLKTVISLLLCDQSLLIVKKTFVKLKPTKIGTMSVVTIMKCNVNSNAFIGLL